MRKPMYLDLLKCIETKNFDFPFNLLHWFAYFDVQ